LRHVNRNHHNELTKSFEAACFSVFIRLMPQGSVFKCTGAGHTGEHSYTGNLFNKMKKIAEDIRCTANFKESDFKPKDSGDGGIDLLAWHPMGDNSPGMPIAFAQCGCSKEDWSFKQLEASPAKHRTRLPVMHTWSTYYFLPLDLRDQSGGWARASDIGEAIIVDRHRLLKLIDQYQLSKEMPDWLIVEKALALSIA
jgi:hypothetical protein